MRDNGSVRFSLLGPIRGWQGASELDLGAPQQRTTLAVLLLHGGLVLTVDDLVAAVWGDEPPRAAVSTARTYISRLRQTLDHNPSSEQRIRSVSGGYTLVVPADAVDVTRFQRYTARAAMASRSADHQAAVAHLRSAMELRLGTPLAGATGPYAEGQRTRLRHLVAASEVDLISAQISAGLHREVLPDLSAKVAEHPLWERLHELFMTALCRSGRQAEALQHYLATRRAFVDALGIEPGNGLRDLQRRILAGDLGLAGEDRSARRDRGGISRVRQAPLLAVG